MGMGDNLVQDLLDHYCGIAANTAPATINAALYYSAATDAGGGTECTGAAYARVSIGTGAANWTVTTGTLDNDNNIDFPQATADYSVASGDPVQVNVFGTTQLDWVSGTFAAVDINNGDTPRISAGNLDITLT